VLRLSHYLSGRSASTIQLSTEKKRTGLSEYILRRPNTVGPGSTNRQPDHAQQHVHNHQNHGESEYERIGSRWQTVDSDNDDEEHFCYRPNQGSPFDVVVTDSTREIDFPDRKLRDDIVGCSLKPG
jgi:hypothetical protein